MDETFTISDLAKEFEITPRTIRFYEDQNLLSPRREGQNRIFNGRDRARLAWILRGKRVGFSLAEINEMLALYDIGDDRTTQRQVTLEKCRDRLSSLERHREDLNATINELNEFCEMLEELQQGLPLATVRQEHEHFFRSTER